jgi:hypothetical protein
MNCNLINVITYLPTYLPTSLHRYICLRHSDSHAAEFEWEMKSWSRDAGMSLTGRRYGSVSERKPTRTHGTSNVNTSSLNVRMPESNLQRHEAFVRVVQEKQRKRLLCSGLFAWRTALTLQRFLNVSARVSDAGVDKKLPNPAERQRSALLCSAFTLACLSSLCICIAGKS